jgi:hypothetical protein
MREDLIEMSDRIIVLLTVISNCSATDCVYSPESRGSLSVSAVTPMCDMLDR